MKLEVMITDDMIRDRIRRVRLAYGRDPQCIGCNLKIKQQLDMLYAEKISFTSSVYTQDRLYGIPLLISPLIKGDDLLFLMDLDTLLEAQNLEEMQGLPELLV